MSVTVTDPFAPNKINKFMGICIDRGDNGLKHWFILRNHVDGLGEYLYYKMKLSVRMYFCISVCTQISGEIPHVQR